eukprot:15464843-Alexandrium_andersonii.AAC.1
MVLVPQLSQLCNNLRASETWLFDAPDGVLPQGHQQCGLVFCPSIPGQRIGAFRQHVHMPMVDPKKRMQQCRL